MKKTLFLLLSAVVVLSLPVKAAPVNGIYLSTDLFGSVLEGRWSEAWYNGQEGAVGSTVSAASWNNSLGLGSMWEIIGPAINAAPTLVSSTVEYGLTKNVWYTTYSGGVLKLKSSGPWWNPADTGSEYTLSVTEYSHDTTKYYNASNQLVSFTTDIHMTATFDDFPHSQVNFILAVGVPTQFGAAPSADFPPFAIDTTAGAWGVAQKIRMEVVPEPATMAILGLGGVFSMLSRKRKTA